MKLITLLFLSVISFIVVLKNYDKFNSQKDLSEYTYHSASEALPEHINLEATASVKRTGKQNIERSEIKKKQEKVF